MMKYQKLLIGLLVLITTVSFSQKNTYVIETEMGDIVFKTYPKKSPLAVKNFEKYEQKGNFEGASFYRVVRMDNQPNDSIKIEVIQGNFTANENSEGPIPHVTNDKTGILHKDGAVSMARGKPGTASVAFFICINDQPELDFGGKRNPDGQGFDAFGMVISGMDVVRKIQSGDVENQTLNSPIKIKSIHKKK